MPGSKSVLTSEQKNVQDVEVFLLATIYEMSCHDYNYHGITMRYQQYYFLNSVLAGSWTGMTIDHFPSFPLYN